MGEFCANDGNGKTATKARQDLQAEKATAIATATANGPAKAGRYRRKYFFVDEALAGRFGVEARRWQSHRLKVLGGENCAGWKFQGV